MVSYASKTVPGQSKKVIKDKESIQSGVTPDQGYHIGK